MRFVEAHRDQACYVKLVSGDVVRVGLDELAARVRAQLAAAKRRPRRENECIERPPTDVAVCWVHDTCADVIVALEDTANLRRSKLWFVMQVLSPGHEHEDTAYRLAVPGQKHVTTLLLNTDFPFGGDVHNRSLFYHWVNSRKGGHMSDHERHMVEHTIKWHAKSSS